MSQKIASRPRRLGGIASLHRGTVVFDPRFKQTFEEFVSVALPGGWRAIGAPFSACWFDFATNRIRGWEAVALAALSEASIYKHLAGKIAIALAPGSQLNYLEFDLDRHSEDTEPWDSICHRAISIGRALGWLARDPSVNSSAAITEYGDFVAPSDLMAQLPGVFWRSSNGKYRDGRKWPGGVRWRIYLDRFYAPDEITTAVKAALQSAGVRIEGGRIELFPNGGSRTRVPLGAGSYVIDHLGDPEYASVSANGRVTKHLGDSLAAFVAAAKSPVPLPTVTWASNLSVVSTATKAQTPAMTAGGQIRRPRGSPGPLTERGQRVSTSGRYLCYLRTHCGLSWNAARAIYEKWLRDPNHVGDLAANNPGREKTIAAMLRDGERDFARQDEKIRAGKLVAGANGAGALRTRRAQPLLTTDKLLAHVTAVEALTSDDRARIALIPDPWVRKRIEHVVGSLRTLEDLEGSMAKVALDWRALQSVAGTRRPRAWKKETASPYRLLVRELQRYGFLGRVLVEGLQGETATVYELP